MPYGVKDDSYVRLLRAVAVQHVRYHELDDSIVVEKFGRHMTTEELWTNENRGTLKGLSVRVNITAITPYLAEAAANWRKGCQAS